MRYYVYWSRGNCVYGVHDYGLEEFDTIEKTTAFFNDKKSKNYWDKTDDIIIIQGYELESQ